MSCKTYPVRFGPHWRPALAAPPQVLVASLPQGHIVCVQGGLACETPQALGKVRDDFYEELCQVPPAARTLEVVVGGSKTRGGFRLEPYRVRLCGDQVAVRVIRGNRAPMSLELNGLVYAKPNETAASFSFGTASGTKIADWVFLSGQVEAGTGGYTVLPWVLPVGFRPKTELEFPVIHNGLSMARVYPDGRVVVDSGLNDHQAASDSAVFARKGPVWLNSVRFVVDESSFALGKTCELHRLPGLAMLQGKVLVHPNGQDMVLLAQLPVAPATPISVFVLNKISTPQITDRYSRVLIDPAGRVWGTSVDAVRVVSLSGIVFVPADKPSDTAGTLLFQSELADWTKIQEAICQGIFDFSLRSKINLDLDRLEQLLVRPAVASVDRHARVGKWPKVLPSMPVCMSALEIEDLADIVARNLISGCPLEKLLARLAAFVASRQQTPQDQRGSMELTLQRYHSQSARASLLETMRFNGRKCMHQLKIAKAAGPEEIELLNETVNWWHTWSSNDKNLTHSSLMGNQDIFTDTGKWTIPDDADVQAQLFKYMAWIFKRGYDTFISEIQTPLFPLIEDLDMESTLPMTDTRQIDEMFTDQLFFIKERARALKIIYPHIDEFTVYLYTSSGFNKSKGRWKSSFHLVWPDIIVNGHLAPIVRQTTVEYFIYKSATSAYFRRMQSRLVNHYDANIWENVFDQTTSNAANGLRMPFSNKASWVKTNFGTKVPSVENRHCFPKGEIRINFLPVEFSSESERHAAEAKAMNLITEAEKRDKAAIGEAPTMKDQNTLVGDRTQYKQSDKNTIHRTSAFFAGIKSSGGDLRDFYHVSAEWVETVDDAHTLSEEEVAKWIQRGSCRRNMAKTRLTSYDKQFVECYEKADLEFFNGHTIESLRETELWSKMTPVCQAGLKARFRKYLQASTSSSNYVKTGLSDVARLAAMARNRPLKQAEEEVHVEQVVINSDDDELDELELDEFELWPERLENVWAFSGQIHEFVAQFENVLASPGGQWIYTALSATYLTPPRRNTNGWSSCMQLDYSSRKPNDQVCVSHYFHCGKVIVIGPDGQTRTRVVDAVRSVCEPDNRLYHRLALPEDFNDGFPLIDSDKALHQRQEYERRWTVSREMDENEACIHDLLTL